ncbi:phage regulatory CII family protein [Aeromonas rivuli]|uniref:phage regulatory CII family protein n=1 Tax=Aeromonas rivuli TaxID=648794 RepID=UPI0005A7B494|nr:phage regulatory CII family protein [Aeromonas rivuli]
MSDNHTNLHPYYRAACASFVEQHNMESVAASIGMSSHVLRNKFNQAQKHKLSGDDLVALYHATHDETLLDGLLFECGLTAIAIPCTERAPSLPHQAIGLNAAVATIGQRALELTERGRITRTERNSLVSVATAAMGSLAILIHDVEQRFQAVSPLAALAM